MIVRICFMSGRRIIGKVEVGSNKMKVVTMWIPLCDVAESKMCPFLACRQKHLKHFFVTVRLFRSNNNIYFLRYKKNENKIVQTGRRKRFSDRNASENKLNRPSLLAKVI